MDKEPRSSTSYRYFHSATAHGVARNSVEHREVWAIAREEAASARDTAAGARELAADARETAVNLRETALSERELLARLLEEDVQSRVQLNDALAQRDQLLGEMREANEGLVLATVRAEQLAELAENAREAAQYNEVRFRALASTAASVIWHADPVGTIGVDQASWIAFTGRALDVSEPMAWFESIHPADRGHVHRTWNHALATVTPYTCQHRVLTQNGYAWVVARAAPVVVDDELREWIGMMTDVSDSVRIEEAKEQFIGILGHDLRGPLAAISLGAEVFRDLPDPYSRVAAQILRSSHRMESMIRDIMDFTRGRLGGGIPVVKGACDLAVIATNIVAEIHQAHPARDIRCELSGDLHGACDADRVEQVISNLLGNALAHGADPIRLTILDRGDDLSISVRNQGRPIPPELLPTLFEPFARGRAPGETRGPMQGLGLGLYIVREIVAAHGGSVSITSSAGGGTEVSIRWPRGSS